MSDDARERNRAYYYANKKRIMAYRSTDEYRERQRVNQRAHYARMAARHTEAVEGGEIWRCRYCDQAKPASEFYREKHRQCKACVPNASPAERRARHKTYRERLKARYPDAVASGEHWRCNKCEQDKPASEFYWATPWQCRDCARVVQRAKYERRKNARK